VLAIDPGEQCGVAIFQQGEYLDSDVVDGFDVAELQQWVDNAAFFARTLQVPPVLVMEKPPRGGMPYEGRSVYGAASVIACRKLWTHQWLAHPDTVNRHRVDVYPVTWRARVLGLTRGHALARVELLRASHFAGKDIIARDEAAAVNIGAWGSHAGAVGVFGRARLAKRQSGAV
jgi:hypothetical protein